MVKNWFFYKKQKKKILRSFFSTLINPLSPLLCKSRYDIYVTCLRKQLNHFLYIVKLKKKIERKTSSSQENT